MQLETLVLPLEAADGISGVIGGIVSKVTGLIALGGAAALAFGTKSFLEAARVDELIAVNTVLAKNAGIAADAVQREADEVRHMGIEYGASQEVIAKFIQNHLDLAQASDLARVAQDAAVIGAMNSTEATEALIHGISTLQTDVLRNVGITFSAEEAYKAYAKQIGKTVSSLTQAEKQQAFLNMTLLKGVAIAGAYEAAMKEPGKVLRSMPRYINDIFVAVGRSLKPAFGEAVFAVAEFVKGLGQALDKGGALEPVMARVGAVLHDMVTTALQWVGEVDWDLVAEKAQVIADKFATMWNNVKKFLEGAKQAFDEGGIAAVVDFVLDINWEEVSKNIIDGINSIDWTAAGWDFKNLAVAIGNGIGKAVSEIDWWGIGSSLASAANNFWAGMFGQTEQSAQRIIKDTLTGISNDLTGSFLEIGQGFADMGTYIFGEIGKIGQGFADMGTYLWGEILKIEQGFADMGTYLLGEIAKIGQGFADMGTYISAWAIGVITTFLTWRQGVITSITTWAATTITTIQTAMNTFYTTISNKLSDIAKEFYNRATGWANQAAQGFEAGKQAVLNAVTKIKDDINAILKKIMTSFTISFSVSMPDWAANLLGGAPAGGGGGGGGGGTGGGGGRRPTHKASGGPVIAGQQYNVQEFFHRPEVFTPTASGRIDAMQPSVARLDKQDMEDLVFALSRIITGEMQKVWA
jgi:hypothetical protein